MKNEKRTNTRRTVGRMKEPTLTDGDKLPPCCGNHAYEKGRLCVRHKPETRYEGGDCSAWCEWLVHHLHPCKCGADSLTILAPCELECDHCGNQIFGNNYDLICADWNRQNPPGDFHPYVSGSP